MTLLSQGPALIILYFCLVTNQAFFLIVVLPVGSLTHKKRTTLSNKVREQNNKNGISQHQTFWFYIFNTHHDNRLLGIK
jgi:hypothetical protein